ncbi:glycosyl transferase family 2 [Rhodoferax lacus]|uniref:Glycosyl transferase family 2 n=1 Tax=Rhodoferax lacus TaxID=2184758 RepID=A0A3E1R999_9BURK|nr:glycosyltransferase [Rhodoferax lacus]RFO95939.1 glycosyl transferase family 2 [Rhodoferax lacus]
MEPIAVIDHENFNTFRPLISVVLPAFNAELYVREAVESILSQTFVDFELIAINDGSLDSTGDILRDMSVKDPRIIFISRENRGLVHSLNEGIGLARGKWIARMDADDISLPNRFEKQINWLEQRGDDLCGSWIRFFGTSDNRIIRHPQSDAAIKISMLFGSPFAHPSVLMRAELAKKLKYDDLWEKCEDYDLWERAARAGWKMSNVPEVLLNYRQHQTQISMSSFALQQKLTQEVRFRYWNHMSAPLGLDMKLVEDVWQMRESEPYTLNMDHVDCVFNILLRSSVGEAREVLLDHMTRLYLRVASSYPDIDYRWSRLHKSFGTGAGLTTKLMLMIIANFRIRADSMLFAGLKRAFLSLTWRG